jgi:hypothetical protein
VLTARTLFGLSNNAGEAKLQSNALIPQGSE